MAAKDPKAGMDETERANYDNYKKSDKKWTDEEAQYLATNPAGRLHPDPDYKVPGDDSQAQRIIDKAGKASDPKNYSR